MFFPASALKSPLVLKVASLCPSVAVMPMLSAANSQMAPLSEGRVSSFEVQKLTLSTIRATVAASTENALARSLLGREGNSSVGMPTILNLLGKVL